MLVALSKPGILGQDRPSGDHRAFEDLEQYFQTKFKEVKIKKRSIFGKKFWKSSNTETLLINQQYLAKIEKKTLVCKTIEIRITHIVNINKYGDSKDPCAGQPG